MKQTTNYKLYKPSYDDDVDIQILNNNMDILDDNLKRNFDKFGQYLPLSGGTMQGDIKLPNERAIRYDPNTCIKFIIQNDLKTIRLEGEQLSFNTSNNKHFKIDDTGASFDGDKVITDLYTDIRDFIGYVKLSTGVIMQWGFVNSSTSDGKIQHVTLNTPMPTPNYAVQLSRSNYTQNITPNMNTPANTASFNCTKTAFDIISPRSDRGDVVFWFVIGGQI